MAALDNLRSLEARSPCRIEVTLQILVTREELASFRRHQAWEEEHSEGRVNVDHVRRRQRKACVLLTSRWVMVIPVKADDSHKRREAIALSALTDLLASAFDYLATS